MKLVDGKLMAKMDKYTIENIGIPGVVLMENAGRGLFERFINRYNPEKNSKFLIVCGKGNNGGDGFVVTRYLILNGFSNIYVVLLTNADKLKGDAKINYEICQKLSVKIKEIEDFKEFKRFLKGKDFDYIFDGILGTGLNSEVRDFYKNIIEVLNNKEAVKIAIDIPSGLSSEKGIPLGCSFKADITYTFGYKKIGLSTYPGCIYAGEVEVINISIPNNLPFKVEAFEIDEDIIFKIYKKRPIDGHKGTFGHGIVIGGSRGFTGAVVLSSKGLLVGGAGLVTAVVPEEINNIVESLFIEGMTKPINLKKYKLKEIIDFINSKSVVVIGPGIGTSEEAKKLFCNIIKKIRIPVVIDADGLNILAENINLLYELKNRCIITPHPGEMARLTDLTKQDIQNNRIEVTKEFSKKYKVITVLKGYRTIISDGKESFINPTGNSALATGGSGDVLSGLIASYIAQKYSLKDAAILGVFFHGLAGEIAAKKSREDTVLAGDILSNYNSALNVVLD